jgi:mRNA interferase MazF
MIFIKNFVDWFKLKPELDQKYQHAFINEGEIWWCSVGENIGVEISGKDNLFLRPILILQKFSQSTFMAIPTTSKKPKNQGFYFYPINILGRQSYLCLHQARFCDKKRLLRRVQTVSEKQQVQIKTAFLKIFSQNIHTA